MKALVQKEYGEPRDVLGVREVRDPAPRDDEVLVRVRAASIHIGDVHGVRGVPYLFRPIYGLRGPKNRVPGTDIAGTVAAVGANVTQLQPGDEVFGWCKGAFAEYACAGAGDLVPKPADLPFEDAAALGVSAQVALQALRDYGNVRSGQTVLVNGASGGVGTFAVQIAKAFGAEVTGVCGTRNVEMVQSIGADHVIDYTVDDYTEGEVRYELILDNVGNRSLSETRRALSPDGDLLSNGAPVGGWTKPLGRIIRVLVSSWFVRQQGRPIIHAYRKDDLIVLVDLVEAGKLRPVVDRAYPLSEAPEAVGHVADGHAQGTTVITM
jgi:NADPH:quinone reductase-like Zn-dependent oxidoreductase